MTRIRAYIENNIDLIDRNAFSDFYNYDELIKNSGSEYVFDNLGKVTDYLYEAGIDPLAYLDYIPSNFLAKSDFVEFDIPNHIRRLAAGAFYDSNLRNIVIPEGIERIPYLCFGGCNKLQKVVLPRSVERINNAFDTPTGVTIRCYKDSYADEWARANHMTLEVI